MPNSRLVVVLLSVAAFSATAFATSAPAQIGARIPIGAAVRTPRTGGTTPRVRREVVVRTNIQKVTVRETVRINYLAVTTEPGATVVAELIRGTAADKKTLVADRNGTANFEGLKAGVYKVTASKDGFDTEVNNEVQVQAQKGQVLPMELEAVKYKLKIATNLLKPGGEVFYALREETATGGTDAIIDREGDYCVVKVKPNGEAEVADLKKGYYFIDIRPGPDSPEFSEVKTGLRVPEDLEQGGDAPFEIDLEAKVSDKPFGATWAQGEWTLPAGWRLDRAMRVRNAAGVGLPPQNSQFRNYVNFGLMANVKLNDDGVFGFALRALDENNYYLLQFAGSKAPDPLKATLYAVKKGVRQALDSRTLVAFARPLASDKGFTVHLQATGSDFVVFIEDSETGDRNGVGTFSDQYKTFRKGAVGIASAEKSNFDVRIFNVCTPKCDQ